MSLIQNCRSFKLHENIEMWRKYAEEEAVKTNSTNESEKSCLNMRREGRRTKLRQMEGGKFAWINEREEEGQSQASVAVRMGERR